MKNKTNVLSSFALISFLGLLLNSCSQEPVDVTGKINETNQAIMAAYEKGDINTLTSFYTADAKMYPANIESIDGLQAIAGFYNAVISMGIKKVQFEAVSALSYGGVAIEEGRYILYVEGDHIADQGKYIVTWKNENGKWKVQRDIWTTNNPAPQQRASLNDTILVVWNTIKADKVAQFEKFNAEFLQPAASAYNPQIFKTARMLRPVEPNKDGSFTYFYIMDPALSVNAYDMNPPLTSKYGEEKAAELLKMYYDCILDKKAGALVTVQTTE